MSEITIKLLKLLNEKKTCNEICDILKITPKKLFHYLTILSNKGFLCQRTYYADGNIGYNLIHYLSALNSYYKKFDTSIITNPNQQELRCLVISDLHFGNSFERLDLIDKAYDYCAKNGIHIIFCCGDLIDGTFSKESQNLVNVYRQIEHLIHNYPFDPNVLTFAVGGDHDLSALNDGGQDIVAIVKNYRHDIILNMYNNFTINIKNDKITLFHKIIGGKAFFDNASIILSGHAHKYVAKMQGDKLYIVVPSLSDINESIPTAIDLTLQFNQGLINTANMKQIYFGEKPCVLSEAIYDKLARKQLKSTIIQGQESPKSGLIEGPSEPPVPTQSESHTKTLVLDTKPKLSQIEKFNQRYHL